jgi:hypothetical protein
MVFSPVKIPMFLLSKTFITMRVEDLDKICTMRNITETKQLLIINVLFFIGTLAVGDQAYEILALLP